MAGSASPGALEQPAAGRLLEEAMAVSDALTRLRRDAQELLRAPLDRDAARRLAVIRGGVARQRENINLIAGLAAGGRIARDSPGAAVLVEQTRERAADAAAYLDLAARAADQAAGPDPAGSAVGDAAGLDLRPDPAAARTPAGLVAALRGYRVWAGEPSYREMSERNNGRPAASTICTALSSDELPKLAMVTAVIAGCGGGKEDWERFASAWRAIRTGAPGPAGPHAPEPAQPTPAQAAYGNLRHLTAARLPASPGGAAG